MVKKIILLIVLVPFLIWILAPKKELFYLLEKRLADQGIVISDGTVHENLFGLTIEHPALYFKGIKVATADEITLWSVLVYTRGTIRTLVFDATLKAYLPGKIDEVSIVHTVGDPFTVPITVTGTPLAGEGEIDLKERTIEIRFPHLPPKSALARYLKHTKGGWAYEQHF